MSSQASSSKVSSSKTSSSGSKSQRIRYRKLRTDKNSLDDNVRSVLSSDMVRVADKGKEEEERPRESVSNDEGTGESAVTSSPSDEPVVVILKKSQK